jgi:hypothetical protein
MKLQPAWCDDCDKKVLAVKNTHKLRNPVATVTTLGVGAKVEPYYCPDCGSIATKIKPTVKSARERGKARADAIRNNDSGLLGKYGTFALLRRVKGEKA